MQNLSTNVHPILFQEKPQELTTVRFSHPSWSPKVRSSAGRLMYYNVIHSLATAMTQKTVITMRLSRSDLDSIEAVRALEDTDRATLLRDFIEDGLCRRVLRLYQDGRLTASRAAEILRIPLREFLEMLEKESLPVNWDSNMVKDYLKARYGE